MSNRLFYYKREVKRKVKDEEVTEVYWDCFNIDKVVRGMWHDENTFLVLMDDGHEQSQEQKVPILAKNGTAKGFNVQRVRDWYYTQIALTREDAERFKDITEIGYVVGYKQTVL